MIKKFFYFNILMKIFYLKNLMNFFKYIFFKFRNKKNIIKSNFLNKKSIYLDNCKLGKNKLVFVKEEKKDKKIRLKEKG